jgi:hypothetical protein
VELESEDVQRSAIVAKILDIYGGATSSKPSPTSPTGPAIVELPTDPPVKEVKKTIIDGSNDAALIPLQHMSKQLRK